MATASVLAANPPATATVRAGMILIEKDAALPGAAVFGHTPHDSGWTAVTGLDPYQLEREIKRAGWTFFYLANEISAHRFGPDSARAMRQAMRDVIAAVRLQKCNCLEITRVVKATFLGIPYASVFAHPRQIPQSMYFGRQ